MVVKITKREKRLRALLLAVLSTGLIYALPSNNFNLEGFGSNGVVIVKPGSSIQFAINNANEGDTILVEAGNYYESIVVNKTVNIVGEDANATVIDGNGTANYIFHVTSNNVTIENFTLKGTNPDPTSYSHAIGVYNSVNVTFKRLIITDVVIGFDVRSSNFTRIFGSQIKACKSWALRVREASCNNTVVDNLFENNPTAIYFADDKSKFSVVYHNNFINNANDFVSFAVNYFDDGYPSGGNYWSNSIKTDVKHGLYQNETGSDGIIDESYLSDRYPLVNPIMSFEVPAGEEQFEVEISTNSSLNSYTFSPERKSLNLQLVGVEGTVGSCRVSIPKRLLSCDSLFQWNITLSNSEQLTYLALEDKERTYLYFTYNQLNNMEIEICGVNAVPEFPNVSILLVLLGAIFTLYALFSKRFLCRDMLKRLMRSN